MHHLFLDTATEKAVIGLADQAILLEIKALPVGLHNSKFLVPALMELLKSHQMPPSQLGLISCGIGPGSYTGIRVGAALAQSMAYALRIPLLGFSSLEGLIPSQPGRYAAILDAKYAGVYLQKGEFDGKYNKMLSAPEVIALTDLAIALRDTSILVTPQIEPLKKKLAAVIPHMHWEETSPAGEQIAHNCYARFRRGESHHATQLKLHYLRKHQAEERL